MRKSTDEQLNTDFESNGLQFEELDYGEETTMESASEDSVIEMDANEDYDYDLRWSEDVDDVPGKRNVALNESYSNEYMDAETERVVEEAVAEAKAAKDEEDTRTVTGLIKILSMMIFAFVVFIFASIAWFTMNKNVGTGGMGITSSVLPFDIATKGSQVRKLSQLSEVRPDYDQGTEEELAGVTAGTYYTAGNKASLMLRFTPAEDDPATEDIDESETPDIGPGSMGELNLYVIPKKNGDLDAYINLDIVAFKAVIVDDEEVLVEIDDDTTTDHLTSAQISDSKEALEYLKGHIMFFEAESGSNAYSYTKPVPDNVIEFHVDNAEAGKAYKVPIYWTWPNTLGQIALKTNVNSLRNGTPVVQETSNMGTVENPTDKAIVLQYLKDNKDSVFKDFDYMYALTSEQRTEYNALETDEDKAAYIDNNIDVDDWIDNADTETYFDLLSEGYNNADFSIGTCLDYFMIEVTVSAG